VVGDGQWVVHNKCDPNDLAKQVKNHDNFVKKYSSDTSWTLKKVDGPYSTANPMDPAFDQRYYLHFTDWEGYHLSISVDCDALCNVDIAHMHFSDDSYQEPDIWTRGGFKRVDGDPGDPYANYTYP
jgi:hypothetical protein